MRLSDYLERAASEYPTAPAVVAGEQRMDYLTLRNQVASAAAGMATMVPDGSRVAVLSSNHVRALVAVLAINRASAVWLPINYRNTVATHEEQLAFFRADVLIFHSDFVDIAADLRDAVPSLKHIVCLDRRIEGVPAFDDWLELPSAPEAPIENPNDLILLLPTGGTTGPSKGIMHSHRSLETCLLNQIISFRIPPHSRHLIIAPMTHASSFFAFSHIPQGGCNVILAGFDPEPVLESIERERITHLFLPPTAMYSLLAHPGVRDRDFSSLVSFMLGAAPTAPDKFREAVEVFGPVMMEAYGQTETLLPMLVKTPNDYLNADGAFDDAVVRSAGRPGLACRVDIVDDDGNSLPPGEPGGIVVRSSSVMHGYYENPDATAEVSRFGWHHTVDIGVRDERGYITVIDRKIDMIISGGFNIFPVEIENVINSHESVLDCAAIGVPDEKWGEAVKAVVELKPGATASEEELIALCKSQIGSVKAPKSVEFWDELPRSAVGKVLKREIRKPFWGDSWRSV